MPKAKENNRPRKEPSRWRERVENRVAKQDQKVLNSNRSRDRHRARRLPTTRTTRTSISRVRSK